MSYRIPLTRLYVVRERSVSCDGRTAANADDVARIVRAVLGMSDDAQPDRESLVVLAIDAKGRVISASIASIGTTSACAFAPREVLRWALTTHASAIIVGHNHPSGDPMPSAEDRAATVRLRAACDAVGLPLLDHVVVTLDGHRSAS